MKCNRAETGTIRAPGSSGSSNLGRWRPFQLQSLRLKPPPEQEVKQRRPSPPNTKFEQGKHGKAPTYPWFSRNPTVASMSMSAHPSKKGGTHSCQPACGSIDRHVLSIPSTEQLPNQKMAEGAVRVESVETFLPKTITAGNEEQIKRGS